MGPSNALAQSYGDEGGNYESMYQALGDLFGIPVVNSTRDPSGNILLVLSDGSVYNPIAFEISAPAINVIAQTMPDIFPPEIPYPTPDQFMNMSSFLYYVTVLQAQESSSGPPPDHPVEPDCPPAAQQAGVKAKDVYAIPQVQDALANPALFPPPPTDGSAPHEMGFSLRREADGTIAQPVIQDLGGGYGGGLYNYMNSIADYHTHPNSAFGPSATDLISLASKPTGNASNLTVSYSRANDGTTYAMVIADTAKASAFYRANQGNLIGTNWDPESEVGIKFRQVRDYFTSVGMASEGAYERAIAATLEDSGIILTKALPGSLKFAKVGAERIINPNGSLANTSDGQPAYRTIDCPPN
ncbi:hypothetical protein [Pedobacter mendelii]|uniref:hypothetical protein n=1 Tax=Pedobacter mendelii TaxID=1908240 RepID=UPI001664825C|nr:hypothetical protein [Pedobacter mendelii]